MATVEQIVAWQLGRPPSIDFRVARECMFGWPAVLMSSVVTRAGRPNPNLYYLCCPYLRRRLAVLEDESHIRRFEEQIRASEGLRDSVLAAQEAHRRQWGHLAAASGLKARSVLIAGAAGPMALKCLHAHLAWYLVHPGYKLGQQIAALAGEQWCAGELCRQALADGDESEAVG